MLFNRAYRLEIDGNGQTVTIKDLRIEFSCRKSRSDSPNELSVRIYNPSPDTRLQGLDADATVRLFAGYGDNVKLLAQSQVTRAIVEREYTDTTLLIESLDGINDLRKTRVSLSFDAGATARQVLDAISERLGFPLRPVEVDLNIPLRGGYSHVGGIGQALDDITSRVGAGWSVQNGDLLILGEDGRTQTQVIFLSPDTGMIQSPQAVEDNANSFSIGKPLRGWVVKSLLQPSAEPGDIVRIESLEVTGDFVIDEVEHIGDNYGNEWHTTLTVYE